MRFRRKRNSKSFVEVEERRDPSPDNVIDLTLSDDDAAEETHQQSSSALRGGNRLGSTRKRSRSSKDDDEEDDKNDTKPNKRVKMEPKTTATTAAALQDEEVEILPACALDHDLEPAHENNNENDNNDQEIAIVGTKNHVNLPHMRQHCTTCPFVPPSRPLMDQLQNNPQTCPQCYCYVCDVPTAECQQWDTHCHATEQGMVGAEWKRKRQAARAGQNATTSVTPAAAPALAYQPDYLSPGGLLSGDEHGYDSFVLDEESDDEPPTLPWHNRFLGNRNLAPLTDGPWPPHRTPIAHTTTKCQYCGWHSRMHPYRRQTGHSPQSLTQWCLACGRKASKTTTLGIRNQRLHFQPQPKDIVLGTKTMKFTLHVHDPSQMRAFRERWQSNKEWTLDKARLEQDLFDHRITAQPLLSDLLWLISPFAIKDIPTDGVMADVSCSLTAPVSAAETNAMIMDEPDVLLLRKLHDMSDSTAVKYIITATWDATSRRGELKVMVCVPETAMDKAYMKNNDLALFVGLWCNVFPCPFADLSGAVKPGQVSKNLFVGDLSTRWKGKDQNFDGKEESRRLWNKWEKENPINNGSGRETLASSTKGLGGFCPAGSDLGAVLKNYFSECLPDEFGRDEQGDIVCLITHQAAGIQSVHRPVLYPSAYMIDTGAMPDQVTLLGNQHYAMHQLQCMANAKNVSDKVNSLVSLLTHTENLGHTPAQPFEGLTVELLPFQQQSLQWAIERETMPGGVQSLHWAKVPLPANSKEELYFNPLLGMFSKRKPNMVRGGMICEQMGMGKTVLSLALILCNPAPDLPISGAQTADLAKAPKPVNGKAFWKQGLSTVSPTTGEENAQRGHLLSRGTLVVCNVSLVGQWIEEAKSKLEDPGLVYSYHGAGRKRDANILAKNSIVVTTYETLSSDRVYHAKKSKGEYCPPLEQIRWWRVICDESHVLRTTTNKSYAVMNIVADNKWLVSGTPISTSLGDLTGQLKFLGISHPTTHVTVFRNSVGEKIGQGTTKKRRGRFQHRTTSSTEDISLGKFTFFMRSIMMRHSQQMKYAGTDTTLMSLPLKEEEVLEIEFTEKDKEEYKKLEETAKALYQSFDRRKASKSWLKLTQSLLPMRIACAGGRVPLEPPGVKQADNRHGDDQEDSSEDDEDREYKNEDGSDQEEDRQAKKPKTAKKAVHLSEYAYKSKLDRLIKEMVTIRDEDSTSKILIFSQFATTLQWLQEELPRHGFQFRALSGDMSLSKRAKALRDFQNDPPTTVFLLSMRAGAVGINLTGANRVFLLEPCFNPSLEKQAIGRVWRLGQTRPVKIYRLIMKGSVEERMHKMLKKKFGGKLKNEGGKGTEEDGKPAAQVVGNIKADKARMVADEFDLLFGVNDEKPMPPQVRSFDMDD